MIANGVTGIREMSGSATAIQRVRKLNTDSAAGVVDGTHLKSCRSRATRSAGKPPRQL